MDRVNYHSVVGDALVGPLIDGLSPFVARVFAQALFAFAGALGGGYYAGELGKVVGDVVCPY